MEKFVYIIIDWEEHEGETVMGIFDTSELAVKNATEKPLYSKHRDVREILLGQYGDIWDGKCVFSRINQL